MTNPSYSTHPLQATLLHHTASSPPTVQTREICTVSYTPKPNLSQMASLTTYTIFDQWRLLSLLHQCMSQAQEQLLHQVAPMKPLIPLTGSGLGPLTTTHTHLMVTQRDRTRRWMTRGRCGLLAEGVEGYSDALVKVFGSEWKGSEAMEGMRRRGRRWCAEQFSDHQFEVRVHSVMGPLVSRHLASLGLPLSKSRMA